VLVAEGAVDAAVDAELALWDFAAVALVVTEAGGRVSAADGGTPRPDTQFVSSNGAVHDAVLAQLG
jgi:histidinol-phosphatase